VDAFSSSTYSDLGPPSKHGKQGYLVKRKKE